MDVAGAGLDCVDDQIVHQRADLDSLLIGYRLEIASRLIHGRGVFLLEPVLSGFAAYCQQQSALIAALRTVQPVETMRLEPERLAPPD
jgi:hypothetical protein